MPYAIRKIGPKSKPYCVVNTETNESKGCSETMEKAKKHLAVLNMREHGVEAKGEKETDMADTAELDTLLKTPQEVLLNKDYLDRLDTFSLAAHAFLGDNAPTAPPLPEVKEEADGEEQAEDEEQEEEQKEEQLEQKQSYTCECLSCGHTLVTKEHCSDITCPECGGEMRRKDRPGVGKEADDVEQYTGGIEPTPEQKAQSEREKLQSAAESRASKYNISVKEGGNRTPPVGYPTAESEYGDPVNYRYPADAEHARPALTRFNDSTNREKGGYTTAEWAIIGRRLARLISRHLTATYQYSNGKLQQRKKEKMAKEVSLDRQVEMVRSAFYAKFPRATSIDSTGPYVREVFSSYLVAENGGTLFKYAYKEAKEGFEFSDPVAVDMEVSYVEKEMSYDQASAIVRNAFRKAFPRDTYPDGNAPYVFEVYEGYAIARRGDRTYKYPYAIKDSAVTFEDPVEVEVEVTYTEKKEDGTLAQVKSWVKDIWDKIVKPDTPPSPALIFVTKEQPDGSFRWISISNTAFLDREQEIVSTEGVAKSIERADESGSYGPLLFWHEPITLGTCDLQAQDGVCLIESGLWDDTRVAKAVREGIDKSPISWGKSIGFYPLAPPKEGVVIKGATVRRLWTDLQIAERSILPSSEAASLFTQIQTRGLPMEQKKKDALVELLGDDLVNEVLAKAAEINKAADGPDAIVKETDIQEPTEESQPTGEEATQTEDVKTEEKDRDDDLLAAVQDLGEQVKSLNAQVKVLQDAQSAPRVTLHRPTVSSDATPSDDDTEEKEVGSYPSIVQAMGRQIVGG